MMRLDKCKANLICGGCMPKTSSSDIFNSWVNEVNEILNQLPRTTIPGNEIEYSDDEFQTCMKKLEQTKLKFDDFPIYPINEKIATELVWDQLRGYNEQPDN